MFFSANWYFFINLYDMNIQNCIRSAARKLALIASSVILMAGLNSCGLSKIKDIEVTSFGLESYSLRGLRSVQAKVVLGVDNPSIGFTVTDLNGILKYNGENFASYTADSIRVEGKCSKVYDLNCTATLSDGVSLMQLMSIAGNRSLEGFTTDVEARLHLGKGAGKKIKLKNLDIQKMMEE